MSKYQHLSVSVTKEVPHSAADFWAAVRDWGDVMSWWPHETAPLKIAKVETRSGSGSGSGSGLPEVRVVFFDKTNLPPGTDPATVNDSVEETLIHADEDARVLAYQLEDGAMGMRNYLAYYEIDELGPKKARVACTARWDIPEGADVAQAKGLIQYVFEGTIIGGVSAMLARQGK